MPETSQKYPPPQNLIQSNQKTGFIKMNAKVLLMEDDAQLSEIIKEYLEENGYDVKLATDGEEAFDMAYEEKFDIFLLDVKVPLMNGFDLLSKLRREGNETPAIFLTSLNGIEDLSRSFEAGCDDYLKKPFHLKELALRIDKVMQSCTLPQSHVKLSKSYAYDASTSTLMCDNVTQPLSKRQLQIIDLLARNRGRVVDFDQFRAYVWDEEYVDNATIRAEVSRLKKSLKEDFIQNIRALGYMIDIPRT